MRLDRNELRAKFDSLVGKFEGYIQMSAGRIADPYREASPLPSWEELHSTPTLFIYEAALYDPSAKRSILIRQIDNGWEWVEATVDWESSVEEDRETYYSVFDEHRRREIRMVQTWKKVSDPVSGGFETLEPDGAYFAGFEPQGGEA